ncbi:hypothetical protein [Bacillus paramycoides]|uniref:hypothetical protein n=1 Tax=Bacillus paramycoides TaxID=2026194 RepID=UPI0037FCC1A7
MNYTPLCLTKDSNTEISIDFEEKTNILKASIKYANSLEFDNVAALLENNFIKPRGIEEGHLKSYLILKPSEMIFEEYANDIYCIFKLGINNTNTSWGIIRIKINNPETYFKYKNSQEKYKIFKIYFIDEETKRICSLWNFLSAKCTYIDKTGITL